MELPRFIGGDIAFTEMKKQTPLVVYQLLQQKLRLDTSLNAEWIYIVNDYHESGDLLTAIAQFEKHFDVPFADFTIPIAAPLEIPVL